MFSIVYMCGIGTCLGLEEVIQSRVPRTEGCEVSFFMLLGLVDLIQCNPINIIIRNQNNVRKIFGNLVVCLHTTLCSPQRGFKKIFSPLTLKK